MRSRRLTAVVSALLAASALFALVAMALYLRPVQQPSAMAVNPSPLTPRGEAQRPEPGLSRYSGVASGRIFGMYGSAPANSPATTGSPAVAPVSKLIVRAIFPGPEPRAVLAPAGEPPEGRSWVVKVGDRVQGERVVSISSTTVVVDVGTGTVTLRLN